MKYDTWLLSGEGGPMDDGPVVELELKCPECGETFQYDEDLIGDPCQVCIQNWPDQEPGILEEHES